MAHFSMTRAPRLILAACFSLALTGCVETTGQSGSGGGARATSGSSVSPVSVSRGKTRDERALENSVANLNQTTRNIIVANTVQGAIAGAIGGCLIAKAANNNCGRGAVAGGLLGGLVGNQVGQQAAAVNRELVQLDATIKNLRNVRERLVGVESQLRSVLARQNSEIASLRRQLAAGQVSSSSVNGRISSINDNRRTVIRGLQASESNLSKERAELVSLQQQSGQNLSSSRQLVDNTQSRIRSLRNSVRLVSS